MISDILSKDTCHITKFPASADLDLLSIVANGKGEREASKRSKTKNNSEP